MALWKTASAPSCAQSSGRVERMSGAVNNHALALLVHGGLPARFWSFAVVHAPKIKLKQDAPVFGALFGIKKPDPDKIPAFESKSGVCLGVDSSVDWAHVLIDSPQSLRIVKSRLAVLSMCSAQHGQSACRPMRRRQCGCQARARSESLRLMSW